MKRAPHLLIAYDGSPQATKAIGFAARLFGPDARATVLYAWEPLATYAGALTMAVPPIPEDVEERDEERAAGLADEGAEMARRLGLEAEGRAEPIASSTWRTIVDAADRERADVVVMGTHGRSGLKELLLGSCSHEVTRHAHRPVLVVADGETG
jgi:nucleotide-binding universal stress UspA family protein